MNPNMLAALISQVLVPEIATAIRAHHNATGAMPTDAQVMAALQLDTQRAIDLGSAWLAAHPPAA